MPLDKTTHRSLLKFHSFWFELTNLALDLKPQSTPPVDPNKDMYPRGPAVLSACTLNCLTQMAPQDVV